MGDKTKNNTYWKRFNGPDNFTVLWNPFDTSNSGFKLWRVCIIWYWNVNFYIVGSWSTLKLTFRLKKEREKRQSLNISIVWASSESFETHNSPPPQSTEKALRQRTNELLKKDASPTETLDVCTKIHALLAKHWKQMREKTKSSHNYSRTSDLDHVLDAAVGMFFNHGLNPDKWFYLIRKNIQQL